MTLLCIIPLIILLFIVLAILWIIGTWPTDDDILLKL